MTAPLDGRKHLRAHWPARTINNVTVSLYKPIYEEVYLAAHRAGISLQDEIRNRIGPKEPDPMKTTQSGLALEPCPFCGNNLRIRGGFNSYGQCVTPKCWMEERRIAIPLDDPNQVATWNKRAKPAKPAPKPAEPDWRDNAPDGWCKAEHVELGRVWRRLAGKLSYTINRVADGRFAFHVDGIFLAASYDPRKIAAKVDSVDVDADTSPDRVVAMRSIRNKLETQE